VRALGACAVAQADTLALPYPSNSFDLVYSFGVLLLIEDLDAAVAELHRVLKPGGTVVTMFYNRQSLHYYLKTLYYAASSAISSNCSDRAGSSTGSPTGMATAHMPPDARKPARRVRPFHR
jgi:ubiquinone/menaquinone biosynthesis C-methylase UbiE